MAKTPNYNHDRRERDKAKAAKKAEKLAAKASAKERLKTERGDDSEQQPAAED